MISYCLSPTGAEIACIYNSHLQHCPVQNKPYSQNCVQYTLTPGQTLVFVYSLGGEGAHAKWIPLTRGFLQLRTLTSVLFTKFYFFNKCVFTILFFSLPLHLDVEGQDRNQPKSYSGTL